jgi:hypothetical protein
VLREIVERLTFKLFLDTEVLIDSPVLHRFAEMSCLSKSVREGVAEGNLIQFSIPL